MKKIGKFIKSNIKVLIAFIIGVVVSGGAVCAATVIAADSVGYTDTNSIGATNVQDAIDKLGERANTWINSSYIDFTTLAVNTNNTILASSAGLCIKRNNKVSCFKTNNWSEEKDHIQQVFSDITCAITSDYVQCPASDFTCRVVNDGGSLVCYDMSKSSYPSCNVFADGDARCS